MTSSDPWNEHPRPYYPQDPDPGALPANAEPHYVFESRPGDTSPYSPVPPAGYYGSAYPGYSSQSYYGAAYPHPYAGYYAPPAPPKPPSKARRAVLGIGAAALAVGLVLSGVALGHSRQDTTGSVAAPPGVTGGAGNGSSGGGNVNPGTGGTSGSGNGSGNQGVLPGGPGSTSGNGRSTTSASVASKSQQVGIVTVVSVLNYGQAESAGTGMVLNSDGEVLTNNHVINGATSITVSVASTGKSYRADVVGTAPTKDVAVLKLRNASGLATAKLDENANVAVGDAITGVGNAGGTGTLRAASGKVTALDRSITATDESGANPEKLTGLIQVNAGIIAGDSGGPLYASDGDIVGMDTAASSNTNAANAYAISIGHATAIATKIEAGTQTSVIHIGLPPFIGVTILPKSSGNGVSVHSVVPGDPADTLGITAGSLITGVGTTRVTTPAQLKKALSAYNPGQSAKLSWTDASGQQHSGSATLVAGPAD